MLLNNTNNFKGLSLFVNEMKGTSKILAKKEIISRYKDDRFIRKAVEHTYNPFKVYHLTSKQLKNHPELCKSNYDGCLFTLLDNLNNRTWTGHEAIAYVNGFIKNNDQYRDIIHTILDRNLEVRASDGVFNKVVPGWIPTFKPALANVYGEKLVDFTTERWYASRKLDGVRCLAIIDDEGNIELRSRQGQVFDTLTNVIKDLHKLKLRGIVIDGEICICDENGDEDFQGIMKEIRRKDHTIEFPKFKMFDKFNIETFDNKEGHTILSHRLMELKTLSEDAKDLDSLEYVEHYLLTGSDHFREWEKLAGEGNWEGFMIRKDVGYEGKRSNNLLKVKTFHDAEYEVTGCDFRQHRVIRDSKEVKMDMLAQVFIEHKGYKVAVGSGFSQQQRIEYFKNPESIIGKTITVQYFEETENQDGEYSLRFPVVKHIFEGKRNV